MRKAKADHPAQRPEWDCRVSAQLGTFLVGGWLVLSGWGLSVGALVVFLDLTANVINPIQELPTVLAGERLPWD